MTFVLAAWNVLKRLPSEVWLAFALLACVLTLQTCYRRSITEAEARGRAGALADARSAAAFVWPSERAMWQRRLDSLTRVAAVRDTVLVRSIRTVRQVLTDTLRDTVTMYVDLKTACTALATDCAAYRATATTALAVADSTRRADSVAVRSLSMRVVAANDDYAALRRSVERASKWRTVERSACVGVLTWGLLK